MDVTMKPKKQGIKEKSAANSIINSGNESKPAKHKKAKSASKPKEVDLNTSNANNNEEPIAKKSKSKSRKRAATREDTGEVPIIEDKAQSDSLENDVNNSNDNKGQKAKKQKINKEDSGSGAGGLKKMSEYDRLQALQYLEAGHTQQEVAAKFGCAPSSISRLQKQFLETGSVARKRRSGKKSSGESINTSMNKEDQVYPEQNTNLPQQINPAAVTNENVDPAVIEDLLNNEPEPFIIKQKVKNSRGRKRKRPLDEAEPVENIEEAPPVQKENIEHALDTESDDEDISPIVQTHQEHHEELNAITWPEKDLTELFRRMEAALPEKDTLAYSTRTEKLNWDNIAFNAYSAEDCKNTWVLVQKRLRKFRLLSEVLHDAKEWISKPWTDFYRGGKNKRHPEFPKRPLSRYMIYYLKKKDKIMKEHPNMEMTDISKMIARMYKNLPPAKQEKYTKLASKYREDYEKKLQIFYELHPELKVGEKGTHSKNIDAGPKKPSTPFSLFYINQLKSTENVNLDKNVVKDKCKEQWKNLSDKKKVVWINWAEEEEIKYHEELKNYLIQNPDFVPVHTKSVLTKEERFLKERMAGKPIKPPSSAYSLFSQIMLQSEDIKKVTPKERMNVIATNWKLYSEEEKKVYKEKLTHLMEQYKLNFASYLESLSEEKRQEELMNIQPKRKVKNVDGEEGTSKKQKTKAQKQQEETVTASSSNGPALSRATSSNHHVSSTSNEPPKKKSKKAQKSKEPPARQESVSDEVRSEGEDPKDDSVSKTDDDNEADDEGVFKREPKQPPKTAFAYFEIKYKQKPPKDQSKSTKEVWDNFSKVTKRKYEKELDELKHAYLVKFEKFLKTMSKPRLKRYIKMKAEQEALENAAEQNESHDDSQEEQNNTIKTEDSGPEDEEEEEEDETAGTVD